MMSSPLVLPLLISTGKHTEWEEVVRGEDKDEAIDSHSKSGVKQERKSRQEPWYLDTPHLPSYSAQVLDDESTLVELAVVKKRERNTQGKVLFWRRRAKLYNALKEINWHDCFSLTLLMHIHPC